MTPTPAVITLKISFDIEQTSPELDWRFDPDIRPSSGRHAGAVLLQPGQPLRLEVDGYGAGDSGLKGFRITECCLVTRPQVTQIGPGLPTLFAAPSPFAGVAGASYRFSDAFDHGAVTRQPDGTLLQKQHWEDGLQVGQAKGRWEMSFLLTVEIDRGADEPLLRVFSFDPESEVGDGTHQEDRPLR